MISCLYNKHRCLCIPCMHTAPMTGRPSCGQCNQTNILSVREAARWDNDQSDVMAETCQSSVLAHQRFAPRHSSTVQEPLAHLHASLKPWQVWISQPRFSKCEYPQWKHDEGFTVLSLKWIIMTKPPAQRYIYPLGVSRCLFNQTWSSFSTKFPWNACYEAMSRGKFLVLRYQRLD